MTLTTDKSTDRTSWEVPAKRTRERGFKFPKLPTSRHERRVRTTRSRWPIIAVAVAGLAVGGTVGGAIGAANGTQRVKDAKTAAAAHEKNALSVQRTDYTSQIQAEKDRAAASIRAEKDRADQTIKAHDAQLKSQQDAVAAQKAQNDQQAAQLQQQQAAANANSFGDGVFQVGHDIQPGQYHTNGPSGSNCYYATLRTSDTSNVASIINNNNTNGPVTLSITSPYFESNGCGTWTKVG